MNYADLKTAIQEVSENTFTDSQIAMFVQQTEQKIYQAVSMPSLRKSYMFTLPSGSNTTNLPADFLSMQYFAVIKPSGEYTFLLQKDASFIREAYPNPATTGTPRYYALYQPPVGNEKILQVIIGPTSSDTLAADMQYAYYPESIVTAGQTWLGNNFDSALLNGALVEAIRFMKGEDDLVKLYADLYTQALGLLKQLQGDQQTDALRSGERAR